MEATYSAELVAPAIVRLTEDQLRNLVNQGRFGKWMETQISSTSDTDNLPVDSQEANEAAGEHGGARGSTGEHGGDYLRWNHSLSRHIPSPELLPV